ncbi:MAG TPA: hypothetical protein VMW75_15625 [Thermoanaerobaculia bacterium]|nr:hypothetical protein [Thermoanaerobaculia bacterium]
MLIAIALIASLAGWYLTWSRGHQITTLIAGQRAAAASHERSEAELRRKLNETRQRLTKAERAIADLQANFHERAEAPVRVAVLQLFPAVTQKGAAGMPPEALHVPKDASIVTFSLASSQEILPTDQAILSRSVDAMSVVRASPLSQGSSHTVSVPAAKLPDGDYTLRLIRGTHGTVVGTYTFRVQRVDR